jgi:hypothetical protein
VEEKVCSVCGERKSLVDFYKAAGSRDGHRNDCKVCNLAAKKARYEADPQKYIDMVRRWQRANSEQHNAYQRERRTRPDVKRMQRDAYYRRTYGVSADDVDAMLAAQGGGCAICGRVPERLASLHLDHDHEHGHLRGLLCNGCNQGLGLFRDDPELLVGAARYLRRTHRGE